MQSRTDWIGQGVLQNIRHDPSMPLRRGSPSYTRRLIVIDKEKYYDDLIAVLPLLPDIKRKLFTIKHAISHPQKRLKMKKQSPDFEQALVARVELLIEKVPKNAEEAHRFLHVVATNCRANMNITDAERCEGRLRDPSLRARYAAKFPKKIMEAVGDDVVAATVSPDEITHTGWTVEVTTGKDDTTDLSLDLHADDTRLRELPCKELSSSSHSRTSAQTSRSTRPLPTPDDFKMAHLQGTTPKPRPSYHFMTYDQHSMYDRPDAYKDKIHQGVDVIRTAITIMLKCRPDAVFGPVHLPVRQPSPVWHSPKHGIVSSLSLPQHERVFQKVVRFNGEYKVTG